MFRSAADPGCRTPERFIGKARSSVLRQVTDLFLSEADRPNEKQIGVFDGVLVQLIERTETRTLVEISERLAPVANASIDLSLNLARHSARNHPKCRGDFAIIQRANGRPNRSSAFHNNGSGMSVVGRNADVGALPHIGMNQQVTCRMHQELTRSC